MYAMVIAGGAGERMRPLTDERPKAMIPLLGRPLIEYQLKWLRSGGITHVVVLCGYKAEVLKEHLGDGGRFGLEVTYSIEDEPLGRGGAMRQGYGLVPPGKDAIVALNGDNVTEQPLAELVNYHRRKKPVATVMLTPLRSPFGVTSLDRAGRIVAFREKPVLPYWINAGIYVLSREFFRLLPEKGDHETTTFPALAEEGKLYGYKSRAFWRSMDTFKDVREAERELHELSRPAGPSGA